MALTLEAEQRLEDAGLVDFFDQNRAMWLQIARRTYRFIKQSFPHNAPIRHDDVAKALIPVLEVHEGFRDRLKEDKIRGKFWISFFADLIIDRVWLEIGGEEDEA